MRVGHAWPADIRRARPRICDAIGVHATRLPGQISGLLPGSVAGSPTSGLLSFAFRLLAPLADRIRALQLAADAARATDQRLLCGLAAYLGCCISVISSNLLVEAGKVA